MKRNYLSSVETTLGSGCADRSNLVLLLSHPILQAHGAVASELLAVMYDILEEREGCREKESERGREEI